jgi:transposase-like protein
MGFACEMKSDTFPLVKKNRAQARNRRKVSLNQTILPLIPQGATPINSQVGVFNDGRDWVYLIGMYPIYRHPAGDQRGFRLTIAQLVNSGTCRPSEVCEAFGIAKSNMDRALRRYQAGGIEAFFERKSTKRSGRVLTPERLILAQKLLNEGLAQADIAAQLDVPIDTFRRAIWDGRLKKNDGVKNQNPTGSDKSQRSVEDAAAGEAMGTACTRPSERMLASIGALDGAGVRFEHARNVPFGGALCALPALLANGLLGPAHESLGKIGGYYSVNHILLLLGFMSLCRIKTIEQLRGKAPGELGKLMGLDRVPEVRCLRKKLDELSRDQASEKYAAALSRQWMEAEPEAIGTLYIDGHVRVYHGSKTKLPRKYVSRQRLCLRGTTDYWVNDKHGRPFFVIDKVVDSGLIAALRDDIVPRLLRDVPNQPTPQQLLDDPLLCRFTLIFDREGYSPAFFKMMWKNHRIACITYHKHPTEPWDEAEFIAREITLSSGEKVTMPLAERGTLVGSGSDEMWMKEVRKLTESGRQISLVGTAHLLEPAELASALFSRWCQENFFRYAMQHYEIDLLSEYKTTPLHDTEPVINPAWRTLDRQRNALDNKLRYRRARFAQLSLHTLGTGDKKYRQRERQKAELLEEITAMAIELEAIKACKKQTPHHIPWAQLEEADRFEKPVLGRKRLLDAVRMIAYRAETALCSLLRSATIDNAAARCLLQNLFAMDADLRPDPSAGVLHVEIHRASRPVTDRTLAALFKQLNEMEITFPGTELVLHYSLLGDPAPANL